MSGEHEEQKGAEVIDEREQARREQINKWKSRLLFALGLGLGLITAFLMRR